MPDGVNIPGGPAFIGLPQPPDVPCDPTGDGWRGPPGPTGPQGTTALIQVQDTPPTSPQPGQLWFDSSNPQLYVWFVDPTSAQWVIATAYAGGLTSDAPSDGQVYGRQNGAWVNTAGSGGYLPLTGGNVGGILNLVDPGGAINIHRNIAWTANSTDAANKAFTSFSTVTGTMLDAPTASPGIVNQQINYYNGFNTGSLGMRGWQFWTQVGPGSLGRTFTTMNVAVSQVTGPPGVPRYWAAGASYPTRGELVCNPNNGGLFRVETPGVSGAAPGPVIPTTANGVPVNAVPDGGVVWSYKNAGNSSAQQIGLTANSQVNYNAGGQSLTETFGHAWGAVFASTATTNATYYSESVPVEIDDQWNGGPIRKIAALQIVRSGQQGVFTDIGLVLSARGSSPTRWKNPLLFSNATDPNGYAIAFENSNPVSRQHMAGAIDMRMVQADGAGSFGGGFITRHFNGQLDQSGAWQLRYGSITPTPSGLAIDVTNVELQSIAITNGGANWTTNSWFKGSDGCYGQVSAVDNAQSAGVGAITGVTILLPSQVPTASRPASITLTPFNPDNIVFDPDVGPVAGPRGPSGDVIWPTPATGTPTYAAPATPTLSLMPSGGKISSAPLTNAANDAAAAAAGVPLNGWYRNGSVMMQRVA